MRIIIMFGLFFAFLSLDACSEKGNFDTGKAAYERKDYETALKQFTLLAKDGNAVAQSYLGWMYLKQATRDDYNTAYAQSARWYRKAAEQGHVVAQRELAILYMFGFGVREDAAQGEYWYLKAADQGDRYSQVRLGEIYHYGPPGTKKNLVAAYALYEVAAKSNTTWNNDPRMAGLNYTPIRHVPISDSMTPEELEAGQALAERMTRPGAVISEVLAQHKLP